MLVEKFNWLALPTRACCHYGKGTIFAAILGADPVFDMCNNALRFILESLNFFDVQQKHPKNRGIMRFFEHGGVKVFYLIPACPGATEN